VASIKPNSRDWSIRTTPVFRGGRRAAAPSSSLPSKFLTDESVVAEEFIATPNVAARRGTVPTAALDFNYELREGESAVLAIRHPSGALTFHLPVESTRRGVGKPGEVRFSVTVNSVDVETGRRGVVSKAIKAILIEVGKVVVDKAVSFVLPKLAAAFEKAAWEKRHLREGWVKVTKDTLATGALADGAPSVMDRSLLLIHGTFSNAASAYGSLANSQFFERIASLYGDRIFAFNHFTVSRTPEENARMLLNGLPDMTFTFDVITHSRGGLVLRNLVERAAVFGPLARRFRLGNAVLVASPNEGTPLATPARWQDTVGWIANLLELFPDNPFTTGAEFVANGLVWLARHASGDLPGLSSMDGHGELIAELQAPPGPPPDAYSALVSNYNPTANVLQRMIDTGVDQFFGSANDLVVPTEGGWRVDHSAVPYVPGDRIGCYGPGGNLTLDSVTHIDFFSRQETVDFLVTALARQAQKLAPVDPGKALPDRRLLRSAGVLGAGLVASSGPGPPIAPAAAPHAMLEGKEVVASDTFHLVVLPGPDTEKRHAKILAHYGSARILEDFHLGGAETDAGKRWHQIIGFQRQIKKYIDENQGEMPRSDELQEFGKVLFGTLFPGAVRRLYDTARSLQRGERLSVILTSTIPWVADLPWEFCFDPVRQTSLAMEEMHFIRNVMTAVPAEIIDDRQRLKILVASAQPMGLGKLSLKEEEAVIRRGFEPLRESGLAEVEVLPRATPASLHGYVSTERFSVVHFIGHGGYDREKDKGFLVFQDDEGNPYQVDERCVRQILCGRSIRLIFLNACETGQGGSADFNSGVAPALVAGGVPIVVANQYKVLDTSATFFAQHFYWSLAQGLAVGQAAREARIAVNYSLTGESIDWAVPVVYARDPNSRLCPELRIDPKTLPSPAVGVSSRRGTEQHTLQVAVWDTHSQFPGLRSTLDRLNAAQTFYGFEIVDLSLPMDAWYFTEGKRYLDAGRFADRLAPQIPQLGVEYLSVIVNEPIAVDTAAAKPKLDYYGWWPGPDKPPVLIFSTTDLGLAPKGLATDRAIANVAVTGIAGYLMAGDSDAKGPRNCPIYLNPDRKLEILTGRQRFCKRCRAKLAGSHPRELKALNALLSAFD
jgi:CHAT domain